MNNNMFGMPAVETNPQPSTGFDIFGPANTQSPQPVINTVPEPVQQSVAPSFDIFGGTNTTPVTPVMETSVVVPTPVVPEVPTMGGIQFDANGNVVSAPMPEMAPSMPEAQPVTPVMETPIVAPTPVVPEMPTMGGIQFDANGNVVSAPTSVPTTEMPAMNTPVVEVPTMEPVTMPSMPAVEPIISTPVIPEPVISPVTEVPSVPITSPIIESTPIVDNSINTFVPPASASITPETISLNQETQTISEFKMPEPIIVTDYTKQYDPIMPASNIDIPSKVDFKEVINAIRECSEKIEKYGYKIDVEEYDLSTLYQVVFKIEK